MSEEYDAEITLASTLRLRGGDLIELAGHVMADRHHTGKVNSFNVEQIAKHLADLNAEFAKFKAAQQHED